METLVPTARNVLFEVSSDSVAYRSVMKTGSVAKVPSTIVARSPAVEKAEKNRFCRKESF